MSLFLNVPYAEKDEAKALGAKWNPKIKKWYIDLPREEYIKFAKWILRDTDEVTIATNRIFVVEGQQLCWKCHQPTRVIGLGIGKLVHIFEDDDGPQYERIEALGGLGEELHLSWTDYAENIPPKLREYLMKHYSVKTGYSKTLKRQCFANHCDHCGALQGNWFLFNEPDSPLCLDAEGAELVKHTGKLRIMGISIGDDLQLDWSMGFSSNDDAYLKYGKYEKLKLSSDPNNESISYEELYGL